MAECLNCFFGGLFMENSELITKALNYIKAENKKVISPLTT